ncbi:type II restriction endonuclease [Candidatus Palauibacter sp.]|uniref:type II restriction endonuclease n=1 Tax=Candidatus Palauibacter sp. TaxID=3101350 RepID=UPI003B52C712
MRRGQLRDHFTGVGAKYLSAVDAEPKRSNQHEIGVTPDMRRQVLGERKQRFNVRYVWLGEEQGTLAADGSAAPEPDEPGGFTSYAPATYYDARENQPHRSPEWRLYYSANPVTEAMREGDALFLAMHNDGLLYFVVAAAGSTGEQQLSWLFGVSPGKSFLAREIEADEPLGFAARYIFDELGVVFEEADEARLDGIIEQFGTVFPKTADFSELARNTLQDAVSPEDDPDGALLAWLEHEEALFRRLERKVVAEHLRDGFVTEDEVDVDGFLRFSLSVQNRRKARMGHSLEHQAAAVFRARKLSFDRGPITEHNHRPDFLFPGIEAYRAAATGWWCLAMLGAKSSCKDRWRQVLVEAEKIPDKHLLTLEPSISESQTHQMTVAKLQLVVPHAIHASYTANQQAWLWTFEEFITEVEARQR